MNKPKYNTVNKQQVTFLHFLEFKYPTDQNIEKSLQRWRTNGERGFKEHHNSANEGPPSRVKDLNYVNGGIVMYLCADIIIQLLHTVRTEQ